MIGKPWSVTDRAGFGWGRYATREEAEDRAAELRAMRDSADWPDDPTAQFDVSRTVSP